MTIHFQKEKKTNILKSLPLMILINSSDYKTYFFFIDH